MASEQPPLTYRISRDSVGGTSGLAVIFAFEYFPEKVSKRRIGTEQEIQYLESFFCEMNLRVHVLRNLKNIKFALDVITNPDKYKKSYKKIPVEIWNARLLIEDSVSFIALTSHGDNASFQISDGTQVRDTELERYFYENACPILRGCPKLFLYNKCRNHPGVESYEIAHELYSTVQTDGLKPTSNCVIISNLNMMSIYTCAEGIQSLRSCDDGSMVLAELPGAYREYGRGKDIVQFFTNFLDIIGTQIGARMGAIGSSDFPVNVTQIPSMERYTLRYPLYFLEPIAKHVTPGTKKELELSTLPVRSKSHGKQVTPYTTDRGKVKKFNKK